MSIKNLLKYNRRPRYRPGKHPGPELGELPPYERGLYYEDVACHWLKQRGYGILDRNYKGPRRSEIDIVAVDRETLVFVEVKARRKYSVYLPLKRIDEGKRISLDRAARDYLIRLQKAGVNLTDLPLRFDAVTVAFDKDGTPCSVDQYVSYLEMNREDF